MNMIDFSKYVDHIFCINYLPNHKKDKISKTLNAIGINTNDSKLFSFAYDIEHNIFKDVYTDMLEQSFKFYAENICYPGCKLTKENNSYIFYVGLIVYKILKMSKYLNYERIIIFEDDILFLKDHNYLINAFDFLNTQIFDMCICQTTFENCWTGDKKLLIKEGECQDLGNDMFLKTNEPLGVYGASFVILTKTGIDKIIKYFEEYNLIVALDSLDPIRDKMNLETIFALKPLCIQEHMLEWSIGVQRCKNINMNINEYI